MQRSSFFNAVISKEGVPDRSYLAEDFARYFSTFIGNGIFPNPANQLQVTATDNNMNIRIKKGFAWINGYMYENTDDYILMLDVADGVLDRIDRVVLRLDFLDRVIKVVIKKGDWNSNAVPKDLQRDSDAYETALADIKVSKGAISISQQDITDLRLNKEMCGIVHGTVEQVDTTAIFNQFENWYSQTKNSYDKDIATWTKEKKELFEEWYSKNTKEFLNQFQKWYTENTEAWEEQWGTWFKNTEGWEQNFNIWFDTIKKALDGDTAGNLLNLINSNTKKIDSIETNVKNTLDENNKKIDEKVQEVTSQYEESVKKTDKKVQDFIDTKNKANGIAGLDENGKVKKEQLPKIGAKIASGEWSDLNTTISKAYTKKIMIGFMPDILTVYIKTKGLTKEIDKERFQCFKNKYYFLINFREGIVKYNEQEDDRIIRSRMQPLNEDKYIPLNITTSTYSYRLDRVSTTNSRCEMKNLLIHENQLEINFDYKITNGSSINDRAYLNIENLAWCAYKF